MKLSLLARKEDAKTLIIYNSIVQIGEGNAQQIGLNRMFMCFCFQICIQFATLGDIKY